jgi:SAM-dependent methyltransferase
VTAATRWADALQEWGIPDEILALAPDCPWGFPTEVFTESAKRALADPLTPTHLQIAEALAAGGVLLDVGCGSGAASLPVAPSAGLLIGVDEDPAMLQALAEAATGRVSVELVEGRWPEVAARAGQADVVVCANVAYNVSTLGPFVEALTASARHRVVLELSAVHPQSSLAPLWMHFWGLTRPTRPTAEDADAVVREVIGVTPVVHRWRRSWSFMGSRGPQTISWVRRRLCLPPGSDQEVATVLDQLPELAPSAVVTLSWPGRARPSG